MFQYLRRQIEKTSPIIIIVRYYLKCTKLFKFQIINTISGTVVDNLTDFIVSFPPWVGGKVRVSALFCMVSTGVVTFKPDRDFWPSSW